MSINLQEVIASRTSEEWQEIFQQSIEEDSAIMAEVMDKNSKLQIQNKVLSVVAGGLALFVAGVAVKRLRKNEKGVVIHEK